MFQHVSSWNAHFTPTKKDALSKGPRSHVAFADWDGEDLKNADPNRKMAFELCAVLGHSASETARNVVCVFQEKGCEMTERMNILSLESHERIDT